MAKVTPKLEQRKDPKTGQLRMIDVVILLDVVFNGKRLWIQTGIKTNRNLWDSKNHRIKSSVANSIRIKRYCSKQNSGSRKDNIRCPT